MSSILKHAGLALLTMVSCIGSAHADTFARIEVQPVETMTLTRQKMLAGDKDGKPVWIAGELRLPLKTDELVPNAGSAGFSAVIFLNGSGGVNPSAERWADEFNAMGIATLILDSFSGRGIAQTASASKESQLDSLAMTIDAYRALGVLAKDRRIDPNRIAVMGFSKGAVAAVYSSNTRFQDLYAPTGARFAAHIGFYTPCHTRYRGDDRTTGKPIRLFHGRADDYIAIGPCREYVARLKMAGADAALTEFPGAMHEFDSALMARRHTLPDADTQRNCRWTEADRGIVVNATTGRPYGVDDPCVLLGPHMGYDAPATRAAEGEVARFLAAAFGLR